MRHSILSNCFLALAVAACALVSDTVAATAGLFRYVGNAVLSYVVGALALSHQADPVIQPQAAARTGLTARERHDIRTRPMERRAVKHRAWSDPLNA